jgi:hypothetical protein
MPALSRRVPLQRYFIRIIILIPNYAVCSFFSLAFEGAAIYIKTARDMCAPLILRLFVSCMPCLVPPHAFVPIAAFWMDDSTSMAPIWSQQNNSNRIRIILHSRGCPISPPVATVSWS